MIDFFRRLYIELAFTSLQNNFNRIRFALNNRIFRLFETKQIHNLSSIKITLHRSLINSAWSEIHDCLKTTSLFILDFHLKTSIFTFSHTHLSKLLNRCVFLMIFVAKRRTFSSKLNLNFFY